MQSSGRARVRVAPVLFHAGADLFFHLICGVGCYRKAQQGGESKAFSLSSEFGSVVSFRQSAATRVNRSAAARSDHSGPAGKVSTTINAAPASSLRCSSA